MFRKLKSSLGKQSQPAAGTSVPVLSAPVPSAPVPSAPGPSAPSPAWGQPVLLPPPPAPGAMGPAPAPAPFPDHQGAWAPQYPTALPPGACVASPHDIVIAVMGVTGAGKTTFIKTVTGFDENVVAPAETGCRAYRFHDGGLSFCLVDTPGLDATFMDDGAALDGISGFLADSYRAGALLSGVVYLHPIHDEKFEGLAEDNLALFQTLCGEGFFPHVVLATGFWSAADPSDAVRRETQLLGSPVLWREMLARGSTAVRLSESRDDRVALLRWMAAKGRQVTRLQHELVVEGRAVADTGAAASTARLRALRTRMQAYLRQAEGPRDESTRAPVPLPQQERAAGEVAVVQPPQPHPPQSQPAAVVEWRQEHDEARPLEGERRRLARQAFRADVSGQHGQAVALISSGFWTGVTATNISMAVHDLGIPLCDICHHSCTVKVAYTCSACDDFGICSRCYDLGHRCLNEEHDSFVRRSFVGTKAGRCSRLRNPGHDRHRIPCNKCAKIIRGYFLHCCECNADNYDLCMTCWKGGRICDGPTHVMEVLWM